MQKLLIFMCVILFPISCSDISTKEDPNTGGFDDDLGDGDEGNDGEGSAQSLGNKTACAGDGYTLYLDDCVEGEGLSDTHSSALSDSDFSDGEMGGKPMDILFVLDTSASMSWWYRRFSFEEKFKYFISSLRGVDWRMLFTNASWQSTSSFLSGASSNGRAMPIEGKYGVLSKKYLDSSLLASQKKLFLYTLTEEPNREHTGSGESGFDPGYARHYPPYLGGGEYPLRALQSSFAINKSLTRESADLVAIIVSNTDENPHKKSPYPTAESIIQEFQKVHGDSKKLYILNLIILPGDKQCLKAQDSLQFFISPESDEGQKIAQVAEEIGGGNFSICLKSYSIVADTIARLSRQ